MTATASARGKRNRNYGHETERMVARHLKAAGWPDACSTRSKLGTDGTKTPGDIDWHPLITLEVKGVNSGSAWPTWCRQAAAAAPPGTVPVVVRRTRGNPDVGQWECRWLPHTVITVRDGGWWDEKEALEVPWLTSHRVEYDDPATGHYVRHEDWLSSTFADLIAAVRQLDEVDR
jgi:hypothetical protein